MAPCSQPDGWRLWRAQPTMRRDQPSNPTKVPQAHQMTLASELLLEPLGPPLPSGTNSRPHPQSWEEAQGRHQARTGLASSPAALQDDQSLKHSRPVRQVKASSEQGMSLKKKALEPLVSH